MQVKFPQVWVELVNPTTHARGFSTAVIKCTFLDGSWVGCPGDLCNSWAEKLTVAQDCTIPGLSSPTRKNCAIFLDEALLAELRNFGAQQAARLNCVISGGKAGCPP